jgi:hypothetical protein
LKFARIATDEWRIRPLKCKDAYLMFDGAEPAVRLVAGYSLSSRMRGVGRPTITPARSIAAERYWVGDPDKDFMTGGPEKITT